MLNTVAVQIDTSIKYERQPFSLLVEIPNIPTVDGVQPRSWDYAIDVRIEGIYSFSIRRNSVAFRSANYKSTMSVTGNAEELAMSAPRNPVVLQASADSPTTSANIEARFLLRDFPQSLPSTVHKSVSRVAVKVRRNSPCPCGSGKKYKRCCGTA